jgi:Zn-dependent metalloprotease
MRRVTLLLVFLFSAWTFINGEQSKPHLQWGDFVSKHGKDWSFKLRDSGRLQSLYSTSATMAKTSAEALVQNYHSLFGVDDLQDLRLVSKIHHDIGVEYRYQQYLSGLPVEGAELRLHLSPDSKLIAASSSLSPGIKVQSTSIYPFDLARSRALRIFRGNAKTSSPTLVLLPLAKSARPVWKIFVEPTEIDEGSRLLYIDASDPRIILRTHNTFAHANGRGTIFMENQVVTPIATVETFRNMDSSTSMSGKFVKTYNANFQQHSPSSAFIDPQMYTTATDPGRQYNYPTTDSRFSEAMAYFHINRVHDQWKKFGFNLLNKRMPVFVNIQSRIEGNVGLDNAFYRRGGETFPTGIIVMGAGDQLENFGHDADVYYHEYGHAVLDHARPDFFEFVENNYPWAFHEGFSDVSAAAITGNAKLAEFALSEKDGGRFIGRNLENQNSYPENVIYPPLRQSESHHTGLIFGGAWWDLQKRIGLEKAQRILYQSLRILPKEMNFFDLRDSMLTADRNKNGAANQAAINEAFAEHGIAGPDPGQPGTVQVSALKTFQLRLPRFALVPKIKFKKGEIVEVFANYTGSGLTLGYNLYVVHFQLEGPVGSLIDAAPVGSEVVNGRNVGKRGVFQAEIYTYPETLPGKYTVTLQSQLGGTSQLTDLLSVSFNVVD